MTLTSTIHLSLSRAEIDHLLNLLDAEYCNGDYYGNKAQYYARRDRIIAKLAKAAQ